MFVPDLVEARVVDHRPFDHAAQEQLLPLRGDRFAIELQGVAREVTHHHVEDLVQQVVIDGVDFGVLDDQLAVHDQREQLAEVEQEIDVFGLLL